LNYLDLHLKAKGGRLKEINDFLNTMVTLEFTLRKSHDWAIDRIHLLSQQEDYEDAYAIQTEFREWMNPDINEHDIFSLTYLGE
jgi:hypothetical protein